MVIVHPLQDIMNYYEWCFSAYIFAFIIVLINTIKCIMNYLKPKKMITPYYGIFYIITSIFCGLIMAGGLYFQAILADNSARNINIWVDYLLTICILSLILFSAQVVICFKHYCQK